METRLEEFRRQYALERQWLGIQNDALPFERQQAQWWDWYYWIQWNWRSMTKDEAKLVYPEIKEKPRKK